MNPGISNAFSRFPAIIALSSCSLCSHINFLTCRPLIENSKAPGKYVKHTPEQLELLLGNLFEGKQERA